MHTYISQQWGKIRCSSRNYFFSLAFFFIPLSDPALWHTLPMGDIPKHKISFSKSHMKVAVNKSGGPIILPLSKITNIHTVKVKGKLIGGPLNLQQRKQGSYGADDFALRVGLVVPGNKSLNFVERQLAPRWVMELLKLAPPDTGLDHIVFLNAVQQNNLLGRERIHPKSNLIKEKFTWLLQQDGPFKFQHTFDQAIPAGALWIGIDGDDSKSNFTIEIEELVIGVNVENNK